MKHIVQINTDLKVTRFGTWTASGGDIGTTGMRWICYLLSIISKILSETCTTNKQKQIETEIVLCITEYKE